MLNQLTPAVKTLLIFNFLVFVLSIAIQGFTGIDINQIFGLRYVGSSHFQVYQLVTYMFLHAYLSAFGISFSHIFSNMFALFMFGPMLENFWGTKRFITYYMITGIGAGIINTGVTFYEKYQIQQAITSFMSDPTPSHLAQFLRNNADEKFYTSAYNFVNSFEENKDNPNYISNAIYLVKSFYRPETSVTVGASGAIFGILIAFGLLFPNTELMLFYFPIPIKAKYLVVMYGAYEYYAGIAKTEGDNVAHFAHLGGMLVGFFILLYWNKKRDRFY